MITMPLPPSDTHSDFIYFQSFTREMNETQQHDNLAARILSAIENTAKRTETSPAHLARLLVNYGLRAPQNAFPDSFCNYVENYMATSRQNPSLMMAQHHDIVELHTIWQQNVQTGRSGHFAVA